MFRGYNDHISRAVAVVDTARVKGGVDHTKKEVSVDGEYKCGYSNVATYLV
jgi:hypothetical protein